ncbi:MAG: rod shape-determining protein [Syntrophomonas sp.]|nr:rod shape-determining protein [Syntrophomonas sp.]
MCFVEDIGIDLGTASVLVFKKGEGIVLHEPSVVALDKNTGKTIAIGEEARQMLGRTPGYIVAIRPLREGVIADYDTTEKMLTYFIRKVMGKRLFLKPRVIVCMPTGATDVEERAVRQATLASGAKQAFMIEEPLAAALGAGLNIAEASGNMVVDVGGGTSDIAVLSLGGIVCNTSLRVGGDKFDEAIVRYVRREYSLMIGERTAEEIKMRVGTALVTEENKNRSIEVRGRDLLSGLPKTITLTSEESWEALEEPVYAVIEAVKTVLEITPPELAADIVNTGIVMTGGGSLLNGLDKLISIETKLPVNVADDPISCVAIGTGKALNEMNVLVNHRLKGAKRVL